MKNYGKESVRTIFCAIDTTFNFKVPNSSSIYNKMQDKAKTLHDATVVATVEQQLIKFFAFF
jgi:hypothetical protein